MDNSSNTVRVTLACFLAYFVMSGMLAPIGIVLPPLADYLGEPVAAVAPIFSWLTLGILLGSALALLVFDVLTLRIWILLVYLAVVIALLTLRLNDSLLALRLSLGVVGTACGIGLAAAASTITQLYAEDHRASMLVITDGSFSVAGIVVSTLAVSLVAADFHWSAPYLAVAAVAAAVVLLVATARFPATGDPQLQRSEKGAWPLPVWLCVCALFLYTLGQYSLLWWLPTYLEASLNAPRDEAGAVVARFWTGMLIAQLFVAWWVLRIGARRLVLLCVSGAFLGSLPLWLSESLSLLPWLSLLWGIANLGLLKIVISFATLAVPNPSPRLVATLLFGATSGTAISPTVTSLIATAADARVVLQFGSLCYLVLAALVFGAWWIMQRGAERAPATVA
ncbi:MFS transporter TsgA [Congregibacter litoralis]|uniref:Major Facilitator Superfamily n=1 Tax=Congregibacter litoralis KT71 TaxID=314285 RepID=A4A7I2_9GAMM|nr:MFS transporter TsgA [Congregibacter litoralis]EAQ98251.2 Major Facilitator Superfamily [Congregibacter litoralis KT71]